MEILERGKLKIFSVDCHWCESKLEYTKIDIEYNYNLSQNFINCCVCNRSVAINSSK